ncbi:helix-turn-helix transcriptional regulator [Arcticibacter sp.]|uniref:helix-turn-helix transcriptional regulator n=1 Tax=Arcticibacter sp. TaxID=1872630 RepID=UPI003890E3B4
MTNYLLKISRSVFKLLTAFDDLLKFEAIVVEELRGIKELLSEKKDKVHDQQLLTVEDLAIKLQVTKRTIYKWEEEGRLVSIRLGSKRYYQSINL